MREFRTYQQDLQDLGITAEQFDNIISHIYDKTAEEMAVLAKAIKNGACVLPAVKRAFERVLDMRQTERQGAYDIYYNTCFKSIPCCGCAHMEKCTKKKI